MTGYTNWADKNSIIITSVTIIMVLTMSQHIENPDIEQFIQIFSCIFEDTQ